MSLLYALFSSQMLFKPVSAYMPQKVTLYVYVVKIETHPNHIVPIIVL